MEYTGPEANVEFGTRDAAQRWLTSCAKSPSPLTAIRVSYFAEAPDPDNETPHAGPVLVVPPAKKPQRPQRWLQRLWLVVFVLFCLEVGIILTVLPWTRLWTDNALLRGYPSVCDFVNLGFVRGIVSGLGLVDIWMGVAEAVTYRENSRN